MFSRFIQRPRICKGRQAGGGPHRPDSRYRPRPGLLERLPASWERLCQLVV